MINSWLFFGCTLCCTSFDWHPQFSVNERCSGGTHTGHVLLIRNLQFSSFKFWNFFVPAETVVLRCFWVDFWQELQKQRTFLTSDDKHDDASDIVQVFEVFSFIKIYICGKFHQYSICGCEVKDFQGFLYWFSIHEMAPFCDFLGPFSPKYCLI